MAVRGEARLTRASCTAGHAPDVAFQGAAVLGSPLLASRDMDLVFAERFAEEWAAAWNSHDLERILAHYTDDVVFASPMIVQLLHDPSGEVRGKEALGAYWATGLQRLPDLHFTVEDVRASVDAVLINYRNERGR